MEHARKMAVELTAEVHVEYTFDEYIVEIHRDGDGYLAFLLEAPTISAHAATQECAVTALREAFHAASVALTRAGKPLPQPIGERKFNGRFSVRVAPEMHKEIVLRANRAELSLNAMVQRLLGSSLNRTDQSNGW